MKKTISVFDLILKLNCKILEAKAYLRDNPDAIDAGYFIEQIPLWEKQIEYLSNI